MTHYIEVILSALAPLLTELIATGLSALLAFVLLAVRRYVGLQAEAILRDGLNQALMTGAARLTPGAAPSVNEIESVVAYAKLSAPDAVKKLGATDDILRIKAKAAVKYLELSGK